MPVDQQRWWRPCAWLHCTAHHSFASAHAVHARRQHEVSSCCISMLFYTSALLCLGTGTSPAKPSLGTAADRAAAHQFAGSLSQKGSVSGSSDRQAMPSMPPTPFAQASARGSPETPQQEVPPSMRVRSLSRQFSERAQQLQTSR